MTPFPCRPTVGPLTVGSLFSGIGGLELGLERAGMKTVWQVEQNDYCRKVLAKHWPDVPKFIDVRDVGAHDLPPVDLICGGFPCQDVSVAGLRAGIADGTRSGLWSEYARIISELRPRFVLVENVPRLLADGMGRVLGDLAAIGYDAEWDCIPASAVGAPHRRDRIFIVAHAAGSGLEGYWRPASAVAVGRPGLDVAASSGPRNVADPDRERRAQRRRSPQSVEPQLGCFERGRETLRRFAAGTVQWRAEPDVGRVDHGIPARVDRLRALGNAVVPQVAEFIGRLIVEADAARSEDAA